MPKNSNRRTETKKHGPLLSSNSPLYLLQNSSTEKQVPLYPDLSGQVKRKRFFLNILILIILISGGYTFLSLYVYLFRPQLTYSGPPIIEPTPATRFKPSPTPNLVTQPEAQWRRFSVDTFSFNYPANWIESNQPLGVGTANLMYYFNSPDLEVNPAPTVTSGFQLSVSQTTTTAKDEFCNQSPLIETCTEIEVAGTTAYQAFFKAVNFSDVLIPYDAQSALRVKIEYDPERSDEALKILADVVNSFDKHELLPELTNEYQTLFIDPTVRFFYGSTPYPEEMQLLDDSVLIGLDCSRLFLRRTDGVYTYLDESTSVTKASTLTNPTVIEYLAQTNDQLHTSGADSIQAAQYCLSVYDTTLISYQVKSNQVPSGRDTTVVILDRSGEVEAEALIPAENHTDFTCTMPLAFTVTDHLYYLCESGEGLDGAASIYRIDFEIGAANRILHCNGDSNPTNAVETSFVAECTTDPI